MPWLGDHQPSVQIKWFRYVLLRSKAQQLGGDAMNAEEPFESLFLAYFGNWPRITASFEERECGIAIMLAANAATQASMDIVLGDFLIRLNRAGRRFSLPVQDRAVEHA